ncbi:hypothetical protein GCM10028774_65810 [Spirosoma jeollabukense]
MPSEQLKAQVNRLHALIPHWADFGDSGVLSNNSLFYDAFEYTEGIRLSTFDEWIKYQGFVTQNLPTGNNKIYLRKKFYFTFFDFICSKINAIQQLINGTGITPDPWVTHGGSKNKSPFVGAQINILNNDIPIDVSISIKDTTPLLNNPKLSLRQIALLYIYQDKSISRGKIADSIAKEYGKRSGERLYSLYTKFLQTSKRTNIDGRMIKQFIDDIEKVIPHLSDQQRQKAETELKTISAKL